MSQLFDKIKVGNAKRSTFDLSHNQVTTTDFGYILPICYRDMLPNDDFVVKPDLFTRLTPMAAPTYGRIKCRVHHFFVPYRILFPGWDAFITQSHSSVATPPYFTVSRIRELLLEDPLYKYTSGSLANRGIYCRLMSNLGLNPTIINGLGDNERIAAFPFLAYYRIWMDYFMDANVYDHEQKVEAFNLIIQNGQNLNGSAHMFLKSQSCCYKKDYFTTAKQSPQDGNPAMVGVDIAQDLNPGLVPGSNSGSLYENPSGKVYVAGGSAGQSSYTSKIGQFTVEAMRAATAAQRYSERNNYVGSKLINRILAHFGIQPEAERIDMAEFIDGDSFNIQIGDITSTAPLSSTDTALGLGMQVGKGVGAKSTNAVRYHAKEHGIFMSVMSIIPDSGYYQGLSRFWTKGVTGEPLDYFTPEFENLGYQEILNKEVYVPDSATIAQEYQNYDPEGVFGYSPRFSEYKFQSDILGSEFVSSGDRTETPEGFNMDSWHLFRKLKYTENDPLALNPNFVTLVNKNTDYDRIFQNTLNYFDHFYFNIHVDVKATRSMVGFAEPSIDSTMNQGDGNVVTLPYGGTRL